MADQQSIFSLTLDIITKVGPYVGYLSLGLVFHLHFKVKKINQKLNQQGNHNKGVNQSLQGNGNSQSAKIGQL